MLDIETLGQTPGCIVPSLAMCAFDPVKGTIEKGKKWLLDMDDQVRRGLTIKPSTLMFWFAQPIEAIAASFPETVIKDEAVVRLWPSDLASELRSYFIATGTNGQTPIWSNPPQFDMAILEAYFGAAPFPFHFRSPRDCRTLFQLCPTVERVKVGTSHDPLDDCYAQCQSVINCFKHLGITA